MDVIMLDDDDDEIPQEEIIPQRPLPRKGYDAALRQLKKLAIVGEREKFVKNLSPDNSNAPRETRKATKKTYAERQRVYLYDDRGRHYRSGRDVCDCLDERCPGCHASCFKCKSPKCGHECRVNRRWMYEQLEVEGTDIVIRNPLKS